MTGTLFVLAWGAVLAWAWLAVAHGGFPAGFWRIEPEPEAPEPNARPGENWPTVTAVIPARDEAETIGIAVESLLTQDYPGALRVVVVDDGSSDGTAEAARAAAETIADAAGRLTVIAAPSPPGGWTGKVWAMNAGYAEATADPTKAELVLFTDADIRHGRHALTRLVAVLVAEELDMASQMVRLPTKSLAEKLVVPAFVYFFRMLYPFRLVGRWDSPVAAAAGGAMLLRRTAVERIGGLSAIRGALIDDCALARAVWGFGGRLRLDLARATESLRPYPDFASLWRMIARSAYTQLDHSPLLLAGTVAALLIAFAVPPLAVVAGKPFLLPGLLAWGLMILTYLPMVRFCRLSPLWALALPAVALFYAAATVDSARRHHQGQGGAWKGRVHA